MILVVGATGTVGRKVVDALAENPQVKIRALSRGKSDWEGSMLPDFRRRGIDVIVGDARSESTVERAVQDCTAIINCSGLMRESADEKLEEVNVDAVKNLIEFGKNAGIQRFIQLSCLGATEHATNLYFSCKWEADEQVRKSGFYWTIFRPSLIFDEKCNLFRILDFWLQRSPLIFLVGSGLNRFQPISATDVAHCIAKSVYDRETVNKVYELCGPETLDLMSLLTLLAENQGRQVRTLQIPSFIGIPLAGLLGKLNPKAPIDSHVMSVLTSEMIASAKPMLAKFKDLERIPIQNCLPQAGSRPLVTNGKGQEEPENGDEQEEESGAGKSKRRSK